MNILITGASRGIGLATAEHLVKKGHNVGMFATSTTTLDEIIKDSPFKESAAERIVIGKLDVTDVDSWDEAIAQMSAKFGAIDVLINNAGILVNGHLPTTDLTEQLALIDVNCKGVLIGCHKLAPYIAKSENGKIINVSSSSSLYGQPEIANYAASKFYVKGLTEGLNIEYKAQGIKVIDIMPMWVKSDMTKDLKVASIDRLGIHLTADDVAKSISKLTVAANSKITAVHYSVGFTAKFVHAFSQLAPDSILHLIHTKVSGR